MTKILVIEDEPSIRDSVIELLEVDGFEATAAENGHIGLQLAKEHMPDLILCDIDMPELDGHGVLRALHQDSATASIPFIFLTAKTDRSDLRQGMGMGADDYLTKPMQVRELRQVIATQLQKKAVRTNQANAKLNELRINISRSLPIELDTPLTKILTIAEQLLKKHHEVAKDAEGLDLLLTLQSSARRLEKLVQKFILYAQIELLASDPEVLQAFQSGQSKTNSQSSIRETAQVKAIQYEREADLQLDLDNIVVLTSRADLINITEELVENALKFSSVGTPVQVLGQRTQSDTFMLTVIDQGQGMTAQQVASMGAYVQFEHKLYEQQGSGLGLTISKRIAELYGGQLSVESTPNVGTTVRVILKADSVIL
jgi:two-component system, sensor histidine kinase and response regulator